jgi:hypothetical protein
VAELLRAVATAALWVGVLAVMVWAVNRSSGRWSWHPSALLSAFPVFYLGQILGIKILNVLGLLSAGSLALALIGAGVAVAAMARRSEPASRNDRPNRPANPRDGGDSHGLPSVSAIALVCVGLALVGLAVFSLVAPTHVWDVQAYHMPMVASYVQNESLAPWPAQDLRQIYRVNGAELQMLWLALLARSDALVELPNLVALAVGLVATFEITHRALGRRDLAHLAVLSVLTAPQVLLGSVTAKNDLVFMALILCCFYWVMRAAEEGPGRPGRAVTLAGLCAGIAIATKVMGINVLGAAGLALLVLVVRKRVPIRAPLTLGLVGGVAVLLLVGDVYWQNFTRSPGLPVGTMPGEIQFRSGLSNILAAGRFYLYDVSFRRLVTPQIYQHDFSHFGYAFPLVLLLGAIGGGRTWLRRGERDTMVGTLALLVAILFGSIIAVRESIQWDQRFMIWLVPAMTVLALSLFRRATSGSILVAVSFACAFTLSNVFVLITNAEDSLFVRSATHLAKKRELASLLDVPPIDFPRKIDGFDRLAELAGDGDSVLYVGAEDTWMYPAWGRRFRWRVRGVDGPEDAATQVGERGHRFVVLEDDASADLRRTVLAAAEEASYATLVDANGRLLLIRSEAGDPTRGSGATRDRP